MIIKPGGLPLQTLEYGFENKLHDLPVTDWKTIIPEIQQRSDQNGGELQNELQQLLDVLSPIKSPTNKEMGLEIDGYEDKQLLLGEGMSKVKLAVHTKTGQKVAIKCISKKSLKPTNAIRELIVLGSVSHPNICSMLQVIDSNETIYLVLEYCSGGELFSILMNNGKLSESTACIYFRQICIGLNYLHSCSVIHRDLKPENILFDSQGMVKLCDFGFASYYIPDSHLNEFCGSPEYAAPEVIAKLKYVGPEVDIWSLGVVLFVMVTQLLPFGEEDIPKLFAAILSGSYSVPEFVSEECKSLIQGILRVNPRERFTMEEIRTHIWTNRESLSPLIFDTSEKSNVLDKSIHQKLKSMDFSEYEIHEFETFGMPGPVKAAAHLLQNMSIPRAAVAGFKPIPISPPKVSKNFQIRNTEPNQHVTSPITKIKEQILFPAMEILPQGDGQSVKFEHEESREDLQLIILQNLIKNCGKITFIDEDNADVLYGTITIQPPPAFGDFEFDDSELQDCLQAAERVDLHFKATTIPMRSGLNQTTFQLLNETEQPWFSAFEDIIAKIVMADVEPAGLNVSHEFDFDFYN